MFLPKIKINHHLKKLLILDTVNQHLNKDLLLILNLLNLKILILKEKEMNMLLQVEEKQHR